MSKYWHQITYHLITDRTKDYYNIISVNSPAHLLLAHDLFYPIIKEFENNIELWRFHRLIILYKEDNLILHSQHEFKFKFYSNIDIFNKIENKVKEYNNINKLIWEIVKKVECINCLHEDKIKNDKDDKWPLSICTIWPYYINGVSRSWIELIKETMNNIYLVKNISDLTFSEKLSHYNLINNKMSQDIIKWGEHAFFHHLNIMFGSNNIDVFWNLKNISLKNYKSKDKIKYLYGKVKF